MYTNKRSYHHKKSKVQNKKECSSGSLSRASYHGGSLSRISLASIPISLHESSSIVLYPIANEPHTPRTLAKTSLLQSTGTFNPDMAISNFHIQYEKGVAKYKPGEEIKGKVVMDVWSVMEILYVEFKIQGYATVRQFSDSNAINRGGDGKPLQEYYINKRILLLSPPNGTSTMFLKPGKYVSEFSYALPELLPPSVVQFTLGQGHVFDISYVCKANICDLLRTRTMGALPDVARIVKSTKATFAVIAPEIKARNEPITHAEQIQLFCSPVFSDPTSVLAQLNKSMYTVGEYIRIQLEILSPNKKRIKKLAVELEQSIFINVNKKKSTKLKQTLIKAVDKGNDRKLIPRTREMVDNNSKLDMIRTGFRLPIPTNFVPSELPSCQVVDIKYCIKVSVVFRKLGGTLVIKIPIAIQPLSEQLESNQSQNNIPLFNKPIMQFPYFAKNPNRDSKRSTNSDGKLSYTSDDTFVTSRSQNRHEVKHDRVTTKYKTCITCCGCCLLCLGYGIYD